MRKIKFIGFFILVFVLVTELGYGQAEGSILAERQDIRSRAYSFLEAIHVLDIERIRGGSRPQDINLIEESLEGIFPDKGVVVSSSVAVVADKLREIVLEAYQESALEFSKDGKHADMTLTMDPYAAAKLAKWSAELNSRLWGVFVRAKTPINDCLLFLDDSSHFNLHALPFFMVKNRLGLYECQE